MTLAEYLKVKGITQKDASHDLRIDRRYVNLLVRGETRPSFALADRIAEWSGFKVMANDWMRVQPPARSRKVA